MTGCNTCQHRPYGEARRYTDCLKVVPFFARVKPKPKDGGANCKLFAEPVGEGA